MTDFIKIPCKHCPFRKDVKPFLHPERAEELAYATQSPYQSFSCHKTTSHDDEGEVEYSENNKECAGFLTLAAQNDDSGLPEGFEPSFEMCYSDPYEMSEAYEIEWKKKHKRKR
jgi:hypothetical protein